jgi:glycopeptide antibiotics resistance protein
VVVAVMRRRGPVPRGRLVAVAILIGYAVCVAAVTVFPIVVRPGRRAGEPWWAVIQAVPFAVEPLSFVLNVVMFVPFGVLLPLLWPRTGAPGRLAARALAVSAGIESVQFVLWVALGTRRTVDVNDLIANTAGAILGLLVLRMVTGRRPARTPARPGCSPPA